jgi:acyl-CoA dehydrogenase
MDWSFTEDQEQLAALTRQILTDTLTEERRREVHASDSRIDTNLWAQLARAGILGVALPLDVDGGGGGVIERCRVLVEIGRAVAPVHVLSTVVAAEALALFGSPEQREFARAAAAGETVLAVALTEELNGDLANPTTTAEQVGHGWRLTGSKSAVAAGPAADIVLVPASTPAGPAVFLIRPSDPGVTLQRQQVTDMTYEAQLDLDGATVPEERAVVGDVVNWLIRHYTVGLCALQLGVCERAVELTAEYSKERVQFDRPIATFQAVGQRLADAFIDVEAIRLTLWQAAWRLSEGLECDAEIATAKFWASDAGHRVAHTAVHIHGGVGIDMDHPLHRYFAAAKRIEFALGSATDHLRFLGRALADEPA